MYAIFVWVLGYMFTFGIMSANQTKVDTANILDFVSLFLMWPIELGSIIGKKL